MYINMTSSGLYALENMLKGPADRADDLAPAFRVIGHRMMTKEAHLFETAGASGNRPWKALDENTIVYKRRKGYPFPERPLSATLRLMRSLTEEGNREMIFEVTDTFLRFGTSVPYAGFHDTGTKDMEQRRPIIFTATDANEFYRIIQDFIFKGELPNA